MEERFINNLIEVLKKNIYDLKDFILTKKVSDKAIRSSFGIYYDEIKAKAQLKEKTRAEMIKNRNKLLLKPKKINNVEREK